jgi:hypothetical protein
VRADRDVGQRAGEHRPQFLDLSGDRVHDVVDLPRDVGAREQVGEVGRGARGVQVHDLDARDRVAGARDDIGLQRGVVDVDVLRLRRRLDLDQPEARVGALEHVDRDVHAVVHERRLVEDVRAVDDAARVAARRASNASWGRSIRVPPGT